MFGLSTLLKQAYEGLKKQIGFTVTILLTMGLSLGALFCIVTFSYFVLLKPLVYPDSKEVLVAAHTQIDKENKVIGTDFSNDSLFALYKNNDVFSLSTIIFYQWNLITSHSSQPRVETIQTVPEYFKIFAVPLVLGRGFSESEALEKRNPVAVISYKTWQKLFALKADVLSKKVTISGVSYRIIGVIDKGFIEPQLDQTGLNTDIWLPWDVGDLWALYEDRKFLEFKFLGKLKQGLSLSQAQQKLSIIMQQWSDETELAQDKRINKIKLITLRDAILGNSKSVTALLLLASIGLLLVALTNIVNLFTSHAAQQQRQLAIRSVVGAKKHQLFKLIFTEIALLMLISCVIALFIAQYGMLVMKTYLNTLLPRVGELGVNAFTLVFSLAVVVLLTYVFAKISIAVIDYKHLSKILQSGGKGTGTQISNKTRKILIAVQVSIAALLVFTNVLLFNHALSPLLVAKGYDLEGVYALYLPPNSSVFPSAAQRINFTQQIKRELLKHPQIDSVSHSRAPLVASWRGMGEYQSITANIIVSAHAKYVDHNYFQLLNTPLLKGRYFSYRDIQNNNQSQLDNKSENFNQVALVNENFARQFGEDVVGTYIRKDNANPYKIIGVVKDSIMPPMRHSEAMIYKPSTEAGFHYLIKYNNSNVLSREQIVSMVQQHSTLYSPGIYSPVIDEYKQKLFRQSSTAIITAVLCLLVLFLTTIGLYGVLSFSINSRSLEFGIRMAVGAKRKHLIIMVIKDNFPAMFLGLFISTILGLLIIMIFKQQIHSLLDFQAIVVFVMTMVVLLLITIFACYWPLRRYINLPVINSLRS